MFFSTKQKSWQQEGEMKHTIKHNRYVAMYNHDLTNFVKNSFKLQIAKLFDLIHKHVILHLFEWSQEFNLHVQLLQSNGHSTRWHVSHCKTSYWNVRCHYIIWHGEVVVTTYVSTIKYPLQLSMFQKNCFNWKLDQPMYATCDYNKI